MHRKDAAQDRKKQDTDHELEGATLKLREAIGLEERHWALRTPFGRPTPPWNPP